MKHLLPPLIAILVMIPSCRNGEKIPDAYGNFESIPVLVSAESEGQLVSLQIEEGDRLKAGQPVGVIDTTQLHLQKEQFRASIRTLETRLVTLDAEIGVHQVRLQNLEREADRIDRLFGDGAATRKQKDDMAGNIRLLKAQLKGLESQKNTLTAEKRALLLQVAQVADRIGKAVLTNPVDGVVLLKYRQQGEIVAPGQTIYKIANTDTLIIRAYISGNQLSSVRTGQQVTVQFDGAEGIESLPGTVTWISAEAEFTPRIIQTREERVNLVYAIKVKVANDGRLKIGMPGEVVLSVERVKV